MEENIRAGLTGIFISLVVAGPFLTGKYIFLLDSVFGPRLPLFKYWSFSRLTLDFFLFFVSKTIPYIYPKALLFLSVFLSFFFAWIFLKEKVDRTPAYAFSFFYAVNPFVYNRLIAGQIFLIFSYAFLPLILKLLMEKSSLKRDFLTGFIISLGALQFHILPVMLFLLFLFKLKKYFLARESRELRSMMLISLIVFALNIGIVYQLAEGGDITWRISEITSSNLYSFRPSVSVANSITSLATLHGFWRQDAYLQVWDFFPFWFILFLLIFYLVVHGYLQKPPHRNLFLLLGLTGLVLGGGASIPLFGSFFNLIFEKVPFFAGYRDSQKFLVLLTLSYFYLGSFGLKDILHSIENKKIHRAVSLTFLLLPFLYGFPMLFGFQGQLSPTDYPQDWYMAGEIVREDRCLFLPWHRYMDFKWVPNRDKRIENPAKAFFGENAITSRNPDMPGLKNPEDFVSTTVRNSLESKNIEKLRELGVKYIIHAKESDYKNYLWLVNKTSLVINGTTLYLFKPLNRTANPVAKKK